MSDEWIKRLTMAELKKMLAEARNGDEYEQFVPELIDRCERYEAVANAARGVVADPYDYASQAEIDDLRAKLDALKGEP